MIEGYHLDNVPGCKRIFTIVSPSNRAQPLEKLLKISGKNRSLANAMLARLDTIDKRGHEIFPKDFNPIGGSPEFIIELYVPRITRTTVRILTLFDENEYVLLRTFTGHNGTDNIQSQLDQIMRTKVIALALLIEKREHNV